MHGDFFMRDLCAALLAAALLTGNAFAADDAKPLPPGKAAGLKTAQDDSDTLFYIIGIGAVAAGIALLASDSGSNGPVTPATTPTTQ
jgi:hypothetical protein